MQLCVDYQGLGKVTTKNKCCLPRVDELLIGCKKKYLNSLKKKKRLAILERT